MSNRSKMIFVALIAFLLGTLVAQNLPFALGQQPPAATPAKSPKHMDGWNIKARQPDADWDTAKKYGVEVFKDEKNNNLIYITETGSIAVVPVK
jgi:hypothetical protein